MRYIFSAVGALALLLLGSVAAQAQIVSGPSATFVGGTITAPVLGPSGCVAPPYSFTASPTSGVCYDAGFPAVFIQDSSLVGISVDSGGPLPGTLFVQEGELNALFVNGNFDAALQLTSVGFGSYWVNLGSAGTSGAAQLFMNTTGNGTFETSDGTSQVGLYLSAGTPNITLVVNDGTNDTTIGFTAPSGSNTINFPAASGTVALTSDIPALPTRLVLASDVTTTAQCSSAPVSSSITFAPVANTIYKVEGQFIVSTDVGADAAQIGIAWPTGLDPEGICETHGMTSPNNNIIKYTPVGTDECSGNNATGGLAYQRIDISCLFKAGGTPSGSFTITYGVETAAGTTNIVIYAGSYIEYTGF